MPGESSAVASAPPNASLSVPPANRTSVRTEPVCNLLACAMTGARRLLGESHHVAVAVARCSEGAMGQCASWTKRCCALRVRTLRKSHTRVGHAEDRREWRSAGQWQAVKFPQHGLGTHSRQICPVWCLNSLRLQIASCSCGHAAPGRLTRTRRRCSEGSLAADVRRMHHLSSRSMLDGCRVQQNMQKSMQTDRWTSLPRRLCCDLHASQAWPRAHGFCVSTRRLFWTTAA